MWGENTQLQAAFCTTVAELLHSLNSGAVRLDRKATSISLLGVVGVPASGQKMFIAVTSSFGAPSQAHSVRVHSHLSPTEWCHLRRWFELAS